MKIHKEGVKILMFYLMIVIVINILIWFISRNGLLLLIVSAVTLGLWGIVLNFYRSPNRVFTGSTDGIIVAPADGKVVSIEEVYEPDIFQDRRIVVSIFMSPFDIHINWFPIAGEIIKYTHRKGRFRAAYLPKSSIENERSSVVIQTEDRKNLVLVRQIAGALARRIVTYAQVGEYAQVNKHLGFIKMGSRVDLYLPLGTEVLIDLNQKVKGNQSIIAKFPSI